MSASEIIGRQSHLVLDSPEASADEVKDLRRKAKILELMFEMSKTLGTEFDLETIFERATGLIFRGTPADRVIALLADETVDGKILSYSLFQIAAKTRDESIAQLSEKMSVSRTITQKVMDERVAILSQDAKTDEQFQGSESIVSQGIRSTICAPRDLRRSA
jgi:GAF domain-containing protein